MLSLLDLIFPPRCPFCQKINYNFDICNKCNSEILYIDYPKINTYNYFDDLICIAKYDGIIKKKIQDFKFKNQPFLYKPFSKMLINKINKSNQTFDIIVSVPIHENKFKIRKYNQAELIAFYVSCKLKIPLISNTLIRIKDTKNQYQLNSNQRAKNIKNAFKITNNKEILNKNILLIDDIFTTGSTVNECSKILKQNGASKVSVITIAIAY